MDLPWWADLWRFDIVFSGETFFNDHVPAPGEEFRDDSKDSWTGSSLKFPGAGPTNKGKWPSFGNSLELPPTQDAIVTTEDYYIFRFGNLKLSLHLTVTGWGGRPK